MLSQQLRAEKKKEKETDANGWGGTELRLILKMPLENRVETKHTMMPWTRQ